MYWDELLTQSPKPKTAKPKNISHLNGRILHVHSYCKSMARAAAFLNSGPHGKKSACVWTAKNNLFIAMVQYDLLDITKYGYLVVTQKQQAGSCVTAVD